MTAIREFAPAKVNLTLEIEGRRADGFHELTSLVTFASVGDAVTIDPDSTPLLTVTGPFADRLEGANILAHAVTLLGGHAPALRVGAIHLEKNLPVAAGLGGGSADAGAFLRAVRRANREASVGVDWLGIAQALGADVPACLAARPLWMTGVGEALTEVPGGLPPLAALLVNPMVDVPADKTARVYRVLAAEPLPAGHRVCTAPRICDRTDLLAFMQARGNQLARAAEAVVPEIGAVLTALGRQPAIEHAAVSGGGPTCFGVFPDRVAVDAARRELAAEHPNWWVEAVQLG
jgi:4-diphosphocytidyl-2-C-methyl-D-erythritol kinase